VLELSVCLLGTSKPVILGRAYSKREQKAYISSQSKWKVRSL